MNCQVVPRVFRLILSQPSPRPPLTLAAGALAESALLDWHLQTDSDMAEAQGGGTDAALRVHKRIALPVQSRSPRSSRRRAAPSIATKPINTSRTRAIRYLANTACAPGRTARASTRISPLSRLYSNRSKLNRTATAYGKSVDKQKTNNPSYEYGACNPLHRRPGFRGE